MGNTPNPWAVVRETPIEANPWAVVRETPIADSAPVKAEEESLLSFAVREVPLRLMSAFVPGGEQFRATPMEFLRSPVSQTIAGVKEIGRGVAGGLKTAAQSLAPPDVTFGTGEVPQPVVPLRQREPTSKEFVGDVADIAGMAAATYLGGTRPGLRLSERAIETVGGGVVRGTQAAVGTTGRAAVATGQAVRHPIRTVANFGRSAKAAQSVVKEARDLPPKAVMATDKIFRALAPTGTNKQFRANAYVATRDLAEIAENLNLKPARGGIRNPDMRVRAVENALNDHLGKMEAVEHVPQIQRNAQVPLRMKLSPDSREGLRHLSRTAGNEADRALAAKMMNGEATIAEADRIASVANKELLGFEALDASQKATVAGINRKIGSLKSLDRDLATNINTELKARGEVGLQSFQRRFAAISRLRDQAAIRKNAVELQRVSPGRFIRSFGFSTKAGMASASQAAVADVNIGRMLEQGFREMKGLGLRAERGIAPPTVTGAIGPERLALPPGQIDVPGIREPKLLPAAASSLQERIPVGPAGPAPDTSFVRGVPAAATSARGKGGKFTKAFTSAYGPQTKGARLNEIREIGGVRWMWTGEQWLMLR